MRLTDHEPNMHDSLDYYNLKEARERMQNTSPEDQKKLEAEVEKIKKEAAEQRFWEGEQLADFAADLDAENRYLAEQE